MSSAEAESQEPIDETFAREEANRLLSDLTIDMAHESALLSPERYDADQEAIRLGLLVSAYRLSTFVDPKLRDWFLDHCIGRVHGWDPNVPRPSGLPYDLECWAAENPEPIISFVREIQIRELR